MEFGWDPEKAVGNIAKHGVGFSDVAEVFKDSAAVNEALRLLLRLAREQSHVTRSA